ncbi:hypothetical protein AX769_20395 [Frondihabitans sp. PAMC 28766]|uniref:DUF4265 domain-containing protein n=1 Tax=Frondihabitans sp. PAMC 28766 TaxID=1795630 RepID=UPI00078B787B|nr:DUF4265 domain-containing protein [Frondihabitans sp. PAMC 28766]AMM22076.1 hypothetical protein AX769_20395 [Frondihabitans sp. PAMC 28766]
MAESVRIDVPLEVVDGWPPVAVETLDSWREEGDTAVVESIPVFALDLSRGDTALTSPGPDGILRFEGRTRRGGHATFRFITLEGDEPVRPVVERLRQLGADVVPTSFPALWALDVPPEAHVETVHAALAEAAARGVLEFEDPRTYPDSASAH